MKPVPPKPASSSRHPLTKMLLANSPFAPYAQAVGWVCMRLSFLEMVLTNLLSVLIPIPEEAVGQALAGGMELRGKLEALRGVAAVRRPNDDWYERIVNVIKVIEVDCGPARNRYAHDVWLIDPKTKEARKFQFKVDFPQEPNSKRRKNLSTMRDAKMDLKEMYDMADLMDATSREIDNLRIEYVNSLPKT